MKLSAQEEYGLRCLLRVARAAKDECQTIPQISAAEGLTTHHVAKLMRILRRGDFVKSTRGQAGGYTLARPAEHISVLQVLNTLGGPVFGPRFCERHTGVGSVCRNQKECTIRCLWKTIQDFLDDLLGKTTLHDLLQSEDALDAKLDERMRGMLKALDPARAESAMQQLIA